MLLRLLLKPGFESVKTISNPNQLYSELDKNDTDIILLDMNFRAGVNTGNEGIFWLREIKKKSSIDRGGYDNSIWRRGTGCQIP